MYSTRYSDTIYPHKINTEINQSIFLMVKALADEINSECTGSALG